MRYTILRLSLLAVLLSLSTSLYAQKFVVNGIVYQVTSYLNLKVEIINNYSSYSGDIVIPETVDYEGKVYRVTSISEKAFSNCCLTSVTIGDSVTSIGNFAFYGCRSLKSVTIGNSVTSIGNYAFSGCSSLASITIGNSVTSIGYYAFFGCSSLTSVTIPNSVTSIGRDTFKDCSSLTSVTIGNSVTSIGESLFQDCSNLKSVSIPNSVTYIGDGAFSGCSSMASVTIPNSVTSIGKTAFLDCISLTSVAIPNSVTVIDNGAFECCSSLTSVTIPNSVTSIGAFAFYSCKCLTSVTIPNSVTWIGRGAFQYCSSLNSVIIGNGVETLYDVFEDCNSVETITIGSGIKEINNLPGKKVKVKLLATNPPQFSNNHSDFNIDVLEVPFGSASKYVKSDWGKCDTIYSINNGIRYFPVVFDVEGTNVILVNGVSNVEDNEISENEEIVVKANNSLIKNALVLRGHQDISRQLQNEGIFTFKSSPKYKNNSLFVCALPTLDITLAESGTLIDKIDVGNINNIESLKITGNLNGTDIMAIRKMENLKLLDLEEAHIVNGGMSYYNNYVTSKDVIGEDFFQGNRKLYKIILPNDITEIKSGALTFCTNMKSIAIPPSVVKISDSFYAHDGLSIQISDLEAWCNTSFAFIVSVYGNGHYLYLDDKEIVDLVIPDGVTKINGFSFFCVAGLRSITIPKSVVSIGRRAFLYDVPEYIISLNPTPPEICYDTFSGEENTILYVPKGSKTLYWLHPYWENFKNIVELDDTSVNDITVDNLRSSDGVYTLEGIKVSSNADNIDNLQKGTYIINGKKVIIK